MEAVMNDPRMSEAALRKQINTELKRMKIRPPSAK